MSARGKLQTTCLGPVAFTKCPVMIQTCTVSPIHLNIFAFYMTYKGWIKCEVMGVLMNLIMVIILQCTRMLNHIVHLKNHVL